MRSRAGGEVAMFLQECDLYMFFIWVLLFVGLISNVIALENTLSAAVLYQSLI